MHGATPTRRAVVLTAVLLALGLAACGPAGEAEPADASASDAAATSRAPDEQLEAIPTDPAVAVVHKTPTCDCCGGHEAYLDDEGFPTQAHVHEADITGWKESQGIPRELWSCHTTEVGGYLVEGHVPAETIAKLLDERPEVDGIALPGMPSGSPGMGGEQTEPWVVVAFVDGEPAGVFDTR